MGWKAILPPWGTRKERLPDGTRPLRVYVYRDWQDAVACAAPGPAVLEAFGGFPLFQTYFGGYMTFGRLLSRDEFLGVWGHRNASRFRRILAERFGDLEIVHAEPPARHSGRSLLTSRPTRAEREALEQRFRQTRIPAEPSP
jgi:hypothetical protein